MTEKDKNNLTMILFAQNVLGARNVKPMDRLEAFHKDVASVILGKDPKHSKKLI